MTKPGATCPQLDQIAATLRRARRRPLTRAEVTDALEWVEQQRGAHMELRAWAGTERDQRRDAEKERDRLAFLLDDQ